MKNLITAILAVIILASCASTKEVEGYADFYKKYKHNEEVINFGLPTGLIGLFLNNKEDKELKQFLKNVDHFRFFIAEDSTKTLISTLYQYLPEDTYKDVMVINDGGDKVTFKARESGEAISEIIILVEEEKSFVVMNIEGEFTYEDVKKISKAIDIKKVTSASKD